MTPPATANDRLCTSSWRAITDLRGAERAPDRQFAAATGRVREEQIADVRRRR